MTLFAVKCFYTTKLKKKHTNKQRKKREDNEGVHERNFQANETNLR